MCKCESAIMHSQAQFKYGMHILIFESGGAFRKWRDIGQKGHFCIWPKSNNFMLFTNQTKIFENMENI
jgi:hypothetical protein